MGGNAFPGLDVPRLPPAEYTKVRDECMGIVKQFYKHVICPPESPGKVDHGDVDLMVSTPLRKFTSSELGSAMNATRQTKVAVTTSFAVPLSTRDAYAQVDVHVCHEGYMEWETWMQGYGDLVQIVGVLNRPIGLTMTDKGLYVRVPEVEATNRKASMVFLTMHPDQVMDFLGLDVGKYSVGFETIEEMFLWCAEGRFFLAPRIKGEGETANDRTRAKKRSVFADFLHNWAPSHPEIWAKHTSVTRDQVLQAAIATFGVEKEYNDILEVWRLQQKRERKLQAIKSAFMTESEKQTKEAMRGLKRWVEFQNGFPTLKAMEDANDLPTNQDDWLDKVEEDHMEHFLKWVSTNYAELRRRERRWAGTRSGGYAGQKDGSGVVPKTDIESGN